MTITDPRTRSRIVSSEDWLHIFDVDTTGPFISVPMEVPKGHTPYTYHQGDFFFPGTPSLVLEKTLESPVIPQWGNGTLLKPNRGLPCGVLIPPLQAGFMPHLAAPPGGWGAGLYSIRPQASVQLDSSGGQIFPDFSVPVSGIDDANFVAAYNYAQTTPAMGEY